MNIKQIENHIKILKKIMNESESRREKEVLEISIKAYREDIKKIMNKPINDEEWKTIEEYPNYQVSSFGRVKNLQTNNILKQYKNPEGYQKVGLVKDKKQKSLNVGRLVGKAFIENPMNKPCVGYINKKEKHNNHISNLIWTNDKENGMKVLLKSKGVRWVESMKKWRATIMIDNENIHLGYYCNEEDAIEAHKKEAIKVYNEFIQSQKL